MDQLDLIVKLIESGNKASEDRHKTNIAQHNAIMDKQDKTNGKVKLNTIFRVETKAIVRFLKWGTGVVGVVGIVNIVSIVVQIAR